MYRGWYKGKREFGSAVVPWEFCAGRMERAVPGRVGLPHQRGGEEEPALGGAEVPRRQRCGIGGTTRTRWARATSQACTRSPGGTSPTTGAPSAPGACRQLSLGLRSYLEAPAGRRAGREALRDRLGPLAAPGLQPAAISEARRRERLGLPARRLAADAPPPQPSAQQHAPAGLHRRQARRLHRARTTTSAGRDRREAADRHQQLARDRDAATAAGRSRCRARWPAARTITARDGRAEAHSPALRAAGRARAGRYELPATVTFGSGGGAEGSLCIDVVPPPAGAQGEVALFDPKGETASAADRLGCPLPQAGRGPDRPPVRRSWWSARAR